jgi:hypothetical protein
MGLAGGCSSDISALSQIIRCEKAAAGVRP